MTKKKEHKHAFEKDAFKILTLWGEMVDARKCLKKDCEIIEIEFKPLIKIKK